MGKSKTTKFKRPQFSVGLPVNDVKEVDAEECDNDGPAAELLEKVRKQPVCAMEYLPMLLFFSSSILVEDKGSIRLWFLKSNPK